MKSENVITETKSLCPKCLKILPATIFERDNKVWIKKRCQKHGEIEDLYWGDYEMYERAKKWAHDGKGTLNPNIKIKGLCPQSCGLCKMHKSHTALANIVVTNRCDLQCWYCFFYAKKMGYVYEPSLELIRQMLKTLKAERPVACNAVQLTGGEPCMRNDLIDIIKIASEEGFRHVQLNTNGIRLSKNLDLALKVREAGVNTLYLSFDGVSKKTNPKNHFEIPGVLENCRKAGLGIVLVPTVINTVNDHEVGDILKFGLKNIDVIRGVDYQPVSLVGRITKAERKKLRITIPDVIEKIEQQTSGMLVKEDWYPVPTVTAITHFIEAFTGKPQYEFTAHFACGMATYLFKDGSKIIPITRFVDVEGLMEYLNESAKEIQNGKSKYLIGARMLFKLGSFIDKNKQPNGLNLGRILYGVLRKKDYTSLRKFHHKSLFVGMMHFQDLYNYDIERVKRCCIHYATPDGKVVPFCAFNVIPQWYRDKIQKKYSLSIKGWERKTGKKLKDDLYIRKV